MTDGQTDGQTELRWLRHAVAAVACKNCALLFVVLYSVELWLQSLAHSSVLLLHISGCDHIHGLFDCLVV